MIPLYGFVEGDTLGLLVRGEDGDSIQALSDKLQASADVRVAVRARVRVLHDGRVLDPRLTVRGAGLTPLDRVDVVGEEGQ